MKTFSPTILLFFACVLGQLHLLCCSADEQDALLHSTRTSEFPASGNQDLSPQEIEKKKILVNAYKLSKENTVQPSVEYVNSETEEKNAQKFVDQMGSMESLHSSAEESKSVNENLKSSLKSKDVTTESVAETSESFQSVSKEEPGKEHSETPDLSVDASYLAGINLEAPPVQPASAEAPSPPLQVVSVLLATESVRLADDSAQQLYDGMPSFDEWKKMMLAEQEKGGQKIPFSPPGKKLSSQKRRRNYASYECGAKIVSANGEAEGTSRILNELVDEYMLNPCKAKIWFVIELCETVQATQIELANFELFSSCPRDFVVYSSNTFPTRDWVSLGTFTATEQRVLQSFELKQEGFGKFIKIELLSHYGQEHYCPLSVVRIFGTSMVDEYEEMETLANHPVVDDDLDRLDVQAEDKKSTNLFGSATDAVMNIVKKAAQALGQKSDDDKKNNETTLDSQNISEATGCISVSTTSDSTSNVPLSCDENGSQATLLPPSFVLLLHKCDQCTSSTKAKHKSYCSSGKPYCRFLQAAFGPAVFQTLCDWVRKHHQSLMPEPPVSSQKPLPGSDFVLLPKKSPPPQIVRVPLESPDATTQQVSNESLFPSEASIFANASSSPYALNDSAPSLDKVELQPSINPSQVTQNSHSTASNISSTEKLPDTKETVLSPDLVQSLHPKASVVIPKRTDVTKEVPAPESFDPSSNNLLTESEEQELFSDPSTLSSEDITMEIVTSATEFKGAEDKTLDSTGGRFEAIPVASQKESVFMRMNNRIKALEVNMSLSSQYLQELSQRYRRQMDDMQRAFNRTIGTLNDTARKAAEKDLKQQEVLVSLQSQVENLTRIVEMFSGERSHLIKQVVETHICFMIMEVIVIVAVMSLYIRRITNIHHSQPFVERATSIHSSVLSKRRNSDGSCTPPIAPKVKKRSSSEEVLNAEALIVEPLPVLLDPFLKPKKKNKKRHRGGIHRSSSHPAVQQKCVPCLGGGKHAHSDGCVDKRHGRCTDVHLLGQSCENCNTGVGSSGTQISSKELRANCIPLQNLTNGAAVALSRDRSIRSRERFSIRKFLKFQKRDSI